MKDIHNMNDTNEVTAGKLKQQVQYHKIAENIHLFAYPIDKYKTEYNISFTAGGAFFEKEGERGVSHLMEHCNVARTKDLTFPELRDSLFQKNIYRNASTSRLYMNFIVSGHKDDSKDMFSLVSKFAFSPFYTDQVLNQEKKIVLRETEQRYGDPRYRLYKEVLDHALTPDSFYLCDVLGKLEDVNNATIDTFNTVRSRMLNQSHIIISAVGGNIDIDSIRQELSNYKNIHSPQNLLPIDFLPQNTLKEFKYIPIVNSVAHDHAILNIMMPFPVSFNNRAASVYLENLIFDNSAGVLYDVLRNKLGLIYSLSGELDMSGNILNIDMTCEIENVQKIVDEVKKVFTDFNLAFSKERIYIIRELAVKRQEMSEDNPNSKVHHMTSTFMDYGVLETLDEHVLKIKEISLEDIERLYNEVKSNLDQLRIIVVSNNESIKNLEF